MLLADLPPLNPGAAEAPLSDVGWHLINGLGWWALAAALVGIVVGAAMWGLGHYSQNYQQAYNGRKGVLVSGVAALLITAAPGVVNFFAHAGAGYTGSAPSQAAPGSGARP